jgi:hypothetical protein
VSTPLNTKTYMVASIVNIIRHEASKEKILKEVVELTTSLLDDTIGFLGIKDV